MFVSQFLYSKANAWRYTIDPSYEAAYQFLRDKNPSPRETVVGSVAPVTNAELLLFTDGFLFLPAGFNTTATTDEIWTRAIALGRLLGLSEEQFAAYVNKEAFYLFTDQYRDRGADAYFTWHERIVPPEILARYRSLYTLDKNVFCLMFPRLDYVLIGPREKTLGARADNPALSPVFRDGDVTVYRYTPQD